MSDSNRGGNDTIGLRRWLWPAIIFAVSVLCVGGIQHWIYYDDAQRSAATHSRDAHNHITTECRVSDAAPSCEREISQAARDSQRGEYDLYSQKAMALWTAIMGAMAVVGIALSGVGVYLIWRTWDATREAAENSRKTLNSFIAKERAIIKATRADFHFRRGISPENGFKISFLNIGLSVGWITEVGWQYSFKEAWLPEPIKTVDTRKIVIPPGSREISGHLSIDEFPSDPCWLMGYAKYTTLEDKHLTCYFYFKITQGDEPAFLGPEWYAVSERHIAMPADT